MRRKSSISFGPGAASLILIVVILSMSVLGILALLNARNDSQLSRRSIEVVEAGYALNARAERSLAALDCAAAACDRDADGEEAYLDALGRSLPEGMQMQERLIRWEESDGLRTLECAVEVLPMGGDARLQWQTHRLTAITTEEVWN